MLDIFVHVANILYVFSYMVRDILWLRILTVVAATCLLPYFYFQPTPLVTPIAWNLTSSAINLFQIWLLILERRPVQFREDEQQLYSLAFRSLKPREMKKLFDLATWCTRDAGHEIVAQGTELDEMMVIAEGNADVCVNDTSVAQLQAGQFVGEMSFLTGDKTTASVVAGEGLRTVAWPKVPLQMFLEKNTELRAALQMVIGKDLVGKLRR